MANPNFIRPVTNVDDRITDADFNLGFDRPAREWRGYDCTSEVRKAGRHRKFIKRRFLREEEMAIWNEFAQLAAEVPDTRDQTKVALRKLRAEIDSMNAVSRSGGFVRKPTPTVFVTMVERACQEFT